jgi:hypothetical protein
MCCDDRRSVSVRRALIEHSLLLLLLLLLGGIGISAPDAVHPQHHAGRPKPPTRRDVFRRSLPVERRVLVRRALRRGGSARNSAGRLDVQLDLLPGSSRNSTPPALQPALRERLSLLPRLRPVWARR